MPRQRQYATNAERQKAYRDRLKGIVTPPADPATLPLYTPTGLLTHAARQRMAKATPEEIEAARKIKEAPYNPPPVTFVGQPAPTPAQPTAETAKPALGNCETCLDVPATETIGDEYVGDHHYCADCAKQMRHLAQVSENRRAGAAKATATKRAKHGNVTHLARSEKCKAAWCEGYRKGDGSQIVFDAEYTCPACRKVKDKLDSQKRFLSQDNSGGRLPSGGWKNNYDDFVKHEKELLKKQPLELKKGDTLTLNLWTLDKDDKEVQRPFRFKVSGVPEGDDSLYRIRMSQCKGKQYADIQLELIPEPKPVTKPKKVKKAKVTKTHAVKRRIPDSPICWTYCGKSNDDPAVTIAKEGEKPTCGVCLNHPQRLDRAAVARFKAKQAKRAEADAVEAQSGRSDGADPYGDEPIHAFSDALPDKRGMSLTHCGLKDDGHIRVAPDEKATCEVCKEGVKKADRLL